MTSSPAPPLPAGSDAVFQGRGLACERGGRSVFDTLSFDLAPGQVLLLTGPNGAGKTSALRLMAGLLRPSDGTILWDGQPIADDPDSHAKRVCLVGHADALKPAWTLAANLTFWARFVGAKTPVSACMSALERLGLDRLADIPVSHLSRGQARRGALARLLLAPRPLWLLDEPTASLDDASTGLVERLIEQHRENGGRAVIATHRPLTLDDAQKLDFTQFIGRNAA